MVGHFVTESYQRPADQDPWTVTVYNTQIGTIAHELGHALNIGPHSSDPLNLMGGQWNFPEVYLTSTQANALRANPFTTATAGVPPIAPTSVSVAQSSPTGWYTVTWYDNSTNETDFEVAFQTTDGSNYRTAYDNPGTGYTGTGWRSVQAYAYRKSNGSVSGVYWACVLAIGANKDSTSSCSPSTSVVISARPISPSNSTAFGSNDGYYGGLFVCFYDSSSNEVGFISAMESSFAWPGQWFKWGPAVSGSGTWRCDWAPINASGNYRFHVTSFKSGNSSVISYTNWEFGD